MILRFLVQEFQEFLKIIMSRDFFSFKRFDIYHNRCAMKVGTDGVLLGAWCSCEGHRNILDVGCGSGVIATMVAQREEEAIITGVEMDIDAAEQSRINFLRSPWSDRLHIENQTFQMFADNKREFDLIVSNPPYFIESLKSDNEPRMAARHTEQLSQEDLLEGVIKLLAKDGVFSAIFPYTEANIFVAKAALSGLYCIRRMDVRGRREKPIKRVLLEFSRVKGEVQNEELIIEEGARGEYSSKYVELTKDFYIKF